MSGSNEWTDWHLTPDGWVKGSQQTDFETVDITRPSNAVLTMRWSENQGSAYGRSHRKSEQEWISSDKGQVDKLKTQFGDPPNHL